MQARQAEGTVAAGQTLTVGRRRSRSSSVGAVLELALVVEVGMLGSDIAAVAAASPAAAACMVVERTAG